MKKIILIILTGCMMSLHAQITTDDLKRMYEQEEYEKAISYIDQFENSKNTTALIILGDCCVLEANVEERQSNLIFNQALQLQSMAYSQGLDYDMSYALNFSRQSNQRVAQLRIQAFNLYTKAAQLGNDGGNQRIALLNAEISYNNILSSQFQTKTKQTCGLCNGTGKIASEVPTYGLGGTKWCDFCQKDMHASHCCQCKICPSCGGTGYR